MPSKSSGKENSPRSRGLQSQVCDENHSQDSIGTSIAPASSKDKVSVNSDGKAAAGPSLFAVMRTAATVKAAERADGAMVTDAAQVYRVTAAALAAPAELSSSGGAKSLQDEREKLKAKVNAYY